jgi:hypothetical protein
MLKRLLAVRSRPYAKLGISLLLALVLTVRADHHV